MMSVRNLEVFYFYIILAVLLAFALELDAQDYKQCVMYGKCQRIGSNSYTCAVSHGPKLFDESSTEWTMLQDACPELVAKYGNNLCCDNDQTYDLITSFALPKGITGHCPSCYFNFRQSFCDFTCSPYQYQFLSPNRTSEFYDDETGLAKTNMEAVNFHIGMEYVNKTYASCKDVIISSTKGPAMDLLCGQYGAKYCTPKRWFDYMGSTENGFAPFDIKYQYMDIVNGDEPIEPKLITGWNNFTYACSEPSPDATNACSCSDCFDSCSAEQLYDRYTISKSIYAMLYRLDENEQKKQ